MSDSNQKRDYEAEAFEMLSQYFADREKHFNSEVKRQTETLEKALKAIERVETKLDKFIKSQKAGKDYSSNDDQLQFMEKCDY